METRDVIYNRRSVRDFRDKAVDQALIEVLFAAAAQAPSAMNSQPWAFGVIQGAGTLLDISNRAKSYLLRQMDENSKLQGYRAALESPDFNIFYNASTLLVILAKPDASPDPTTDCCLAAENLMLMARELGLGTCWIGFSRFFLNTPEAKRELGIPEDYSIIAPLIVGYPAGEMSTMDKNAPEVLFRK